MKKLSILLITMMMLLLACTGGAFAADNVSIVIDDRALSFTEDSGAPFIDESSRTQVPLRVTMEACGCQVGWNSETRTATVQKDGTVVDVPIDQSFIVVNGEEEANDTSAVIINSRTYLPIRAVLEAFGMEISWNSTTKTVSVDTDPVQYQYFVSGISVNESSDSCTILVSGYGDGLEDYSSFSLTDPQRFVLDLEMSAMKVTDSSIPVWNGMVDKVRCSQFDDDTARIVIDLTEENATVETDLSADKKTVSVEISLDQGEDDSGVTPKDDDPVIVSGDVPMLDESLANYLIVLDPGHGGTDPGSLGKVNGETVLYEKTPNLKAATYAYNYLKEAGARVEMTRYDDSSVNIYDRPAYANEIGASLFVSMHNNSSTSSLASGTELLYNSDKATEADYLVGSKAVADAIQTQMTKYVGLKIRRNSNQPAYIVLNRSVMPAVIVEGAFMSNPSDLALLRTDAFAQNYGRAVATGIINALNATVK